MPRHRLPASLAALLLVTLALPACTPEAPSLVPELRQQFQPGLRLADAITALKARNTNFSVRSVAECESIARRSAMAAELRPRGGPCVFGKIPVSKNWLGGRSDVILQLVFNPDDTLADGNFEEVRTSVGW